MVKPIIVNAEPVFSFPEGIAWIDGTPVKLNKGDEQKVVDFTGSKMKNNETAIDDVKKEVIPQHRQKQNVDVYLSDDDSSEEEARVVVKKVAAPKAKNNAVAVKAHVAPMKEQHLTDEQKENAFWAAIDTLGWKNKTDMEYDITRARKTTANITELHMRVDLIAYMLIDNECYAALDLPEKQKLTYHIVLLGRDWFENIINSPDLASYIILNGEMQNFTIDEVDKLFN